MDLADYIVPGVPVEAQHDKVERHGLQVVERKPVESKVLVVGGIPGIAYDPEDGKSGWGNGL